MNQLRYPLVLCAYCDLEWVKSRLPNRVVMADKYADNGRIYHWDRKNRFRVSKVKRGIDESKQNC